MRVKILVDRSSPGLATVVSAWLERWHGAVSVVSETFGCGANVDLYEIEAPPEAVATLPPEVLAHQPGGSPQVADSTDRPRVPGAHRDASASRPPCPPATPPRACE